jgi:hypothetical protein
LASAPIESTPPLMLVPPVYKFVAASVSVPAPDLVSAVPAPAMTPDTVPAVPMFSVISPPLVLSPPIVAAVLASIVSAAPAVAMVSAAAPAMVNVGAVNVTELRLACARLRRSSARSSIVMLVVAAMEMFVAAAIPSSSDSKIEVGVVSVARTVPVAPDGLPAKLVAERSVSSPSPEPSRMVIVADIWLLPCPHHARAVPSMISHA